MKPRLGLKILMLATLLLPIGSFAGDPAPIYRNPFTTNTSPQNSPLTFSAPITISSQLSMGGDIFMDTYDLTVKRSIMAGDYETAFDAGLIEFATGLDPVMRISSGDNNNLDIHSDGAISIRSTASVTNEGTAFHFVGGPMLGNASGLTNLNATTPGAATVLNIPTFDGTNCVAHPNVIVSDRLVGGYRYWLTYTPYPGADREWVSVAGSHDLQNWEKPSGMSSNVLFAPGDLAGVGCANGWWADPEIVEHTNGTLYVFGLAQYWSGGPPVNHYRERVCMRTSTDGITWSEITPCFSATNTSSTPLIAGPEAVVWTNGLLRMYYVDQSQAFTNRLVYREATDWTLTNWGAVVQCHYPLWTNQSSMFNPWHGELKYADGVLHWLVSPYEAAWHSIYYATCSDGTGTNFTFASLGNVAAKSGNGFDTGGWYKPSGILKSGGKWDLILGTYRAGVVVTEPWKFELTRDTTIPMPKSEMIYWQSNSWQAPVVPPASLLSTATGPTTWNGLANWFVGNRFSIFAPTPIRYANIFWSGNTGRVTATIFRLANPKSTASIQAWANSTEASGTRFDFGPMTLPPGDYILGYWSDNNGSSTYHATGAASSTNAMLSFAINSSVWPPAAWSAAPAFSQRYLVGVSLDGDYSQP